MLKIGDKVKLIKNNNSSLYDKYRIFPLEYIPIGTIVTISEIKVVCDDYLNYNEYYFNEMPGNWYALDFELEPYKREELL